MSSPIRVLRGVLSALRPRQWVKNGLVVVAPVAAADLTNRTVLTHTLYAFLAFSCTASGLYLLNDVRDKQSDLAHPAKRNRAIASGIVPVAVALILFVVLLVVGGLLAWVGGTDSHALFYVLLTYAVLTMAYSSGLKRQPVIEFAIVASGFFLRALGGAVASNLFVSNWFLAVTAFAALFLVIGKRSAELQELGERAATHRRVLSEYTLPFLQSSLTLVASVVVTTYCLWAFDVSSTGLSNVHHRVVLIRLTVVPVVLAILHILRLQERGEGGAPEDLVFSDRTLQALGLVWGVLFFFGIQA